MTPRACPLSPDDRRKKLIEATLPLLVEHGRAVTSRQIARAAGVAEGTIFRAFGTKDELIEATVHHGFAQANYLESIEAIAKDGPLRDRLLALVEVLQRRYLDSFGLMRALGMVAPPDDPQLSADRARYLDRVLAAMVAVVEPDQRRLRMPAAYVVHVLRLLTFSGSNAEIAHGQLLTPDDIVDLVLHGALNTPADNFTESTH